jgi:hypothetical protein
MPADQLGRVLRRMIRRTTGRVLKLARSSDRPRTDPTGKLEQCEEVVTLCCGLLDQLAADTTPEA